ncbi:MAG: NAD-dependent epimerase/dehydratase family protein [Elusimicrobiota bacterium]
MRAFVTGGAGFIGSHLVDELMARGHRVTAYDDLRTGFRSFLDRQRHQPRFRLVRGDVLDLKKLKSSMKGHDTVFHFAANADVRGGAADTRIDLEQNTIGTHRVLEAMRHCGAKSIVFASSAVVYGEPSVFPTPETYAPLQTSLYGASKLAAEALIQAYGEYYGIQSRSFRFVSWIGERYTHGVVFDFVKKLKRDPRSLEVLGDGKQRKSYLYVKDGVRGIMTALRAPLAGRKGIFNLGHDGTMGVLEVARLVCREMGLAGVRIDCAGGRRGWVGDSPIVRLDCRRIKKLGWRPETSIETGMRRTARYLLDNPNLLAGRH